MQSFISVTYHHTDTICLPTNLVVSTSFNRLPVATIDYFCLSKDENSINDVYLVSSLRSRGKIQCIKFTGSAILLNLGSSSRKEGVSQYFSDYGK